MIFECTVKEFLIVAPEYKSQIPSYVDIEDKKNCIRIDLDERTIALFRR